MAWFPSPRGEEEDWSCLGFETNKLWKKLVGRGWFRDDCCGGGGRIWASTRGYIGSVFLKEWNLFLLVGIFFYRFIRDLDWIFSFLFFSFCLSIVNFLIIYFIFGISCVEMEFQRLCIIDFYFCFFETLLKVSRILEFLLILFLFRHDDFLVIYRKFF